jgi:hypothetical protein
MSDCQHCRGDGVCKDDYHESSLNEIAADFVLGPDCPSGCGGGSMGGGDCPHCDGTGHEQG